MITHHDGCYANITVICGLVTALLMGPSAVSAQISSQQRADLVLRLIPSPARSQATVLLRDAEGAELTYRSGDGPFLCVSDASNSQRLSMVCHHRVLEDRLRFERALSAETGLRGDAFRTRLCADVASRGLHVPEGAMEITASLAVEPGGSHGNEMTVYHLLWLPFATEASSGVTDEDPGAGRPWLHHAGTCGAHVMWSEVMDVRTR